MAMPKFPCLEAVRSVVVRLTSTLKGLEAMGLKLPKQPAILKQSRSSQGAHIYMDFPSVGATQKYYDGATLADGVTVIENAAREPEIVDLALAE